MLFCTSVATWAQTKIESAKKNPKFIHPMQFQKAPAENFQLKTCDGHATMVIDAANGARIQSLKWDSTEVLSQIPTPNMYGSTFWTSPQKEWNWPPVREHDMGSYIVEQHDGKIIMTSAVPERLPLRMSKTFTVIKDMFCITYSLTNEGSIDRNVAPWEVTRVPGEGEISFRANADSIWPAGLMNFTQHGDRAVFSIDKIDKQRKINVNGAPMEENGNNASQSIKKTDGMSYISYAHNKLIFTKFFPDLKAGEAAPGEDEIQVYIHQGSLYCELENQGPYTLLHPGESLTWTVYWQLKPSE